MANGVSKHRWMAGGSKTVCTSHVLAWFGIDASAYHYSGSVNQRASVLRRHGWAVRSRKSALTGPVLSRSVGQLRAAIVKRQTGRQADQSGTVYMVWVRCNARVTHLILLDSDGKTIVDTAPKARDRRKVITVHAVWMPRVNTG